MSDLETRLAAIAWTMVEMPCTPAVMEGLRAAAAIGAESGRSVGYADGYCDGYAKGAEDRERQIVERVREMRFLDAGPVRSQEAREYRNGYRDSLGELLEQLEAGAGKVPR